MSTLAKLLARKQALLERLERIGRNAHRPGGPETAKEARYDDVASSRLSRITG